MEETRAIHVRRTPAFLTTKTSRNSLASPALMFGLAVLEASIRARLEVKAKAETSDRVKLVLR